MFVCRAMLPQVGAWAPTPGRYLGMLHTGPLMHSSVVQIYLDAVAQNCPVGALIQHAGEGDISQFELMLLKVRCLEPPRQHIPHT
jgi:hypothetical protein